MPTAIVTGATGILGRAIVLELGNRPDYWTSLYALSRSKKENYPSHVHHTHIDLTSSASTMCEDLQHIPSIDYVFFAAYLAGNDEQEMCDTNGAMLENFLEALKQTGLDKSIKRVLLVTGAKQYGVHLGKPKIPMEESDPRLVGDSFPPNFYYVQQDILQEYSSKSPWDWTVTYPNDVIGVAKGNFMNLSTAVGLYAVINKELSPSKQLPFPGSDVFYNLVDNFTSAPFHAKFCAWAATAPTASNQAFNVINGDCESWQNLWPKVAKHFGMTVPPDQFTNAKGDDESVANLVERPPISVQAAEMGLEGSPYVKQSVVRQRIDLVRWSQRQDVKQAWERVAEREGLDRDAFEKATWGFLGFVLGREFDMVISMTKARKAGFMDYEDTWSSLEDTFLELEREKILPKVRT